MELSHAYWATETGTDGGIWSSRGEREMASAFDEWEWDDQDRKRQFPSAAAYFWLPYSHMNWMASRMHPPLKRSPKKLIEVALPLDAINAASKREKSIRHGHPSTLHLWWARRPLAAARAVIFAQMVDDPSANPGRFPTEEAKRRERERLFRLIEDLVRWENTTNEEVLEPARREIRRSWVRTCSDNADHPRAKELFDLERLPAFHDPFAGGGALPLEAQRLGLEAHASDLNPVAVLINKAMIEIPPKFAGRAPVNPGARSGGPSVPRSLIDREWRGAQGLADDVRYYGQWMRGEAQRRIGQLYPPFKVTKEMVRERSDLKQYEGHELTVIAWLWARTVKSPNPAYSHVDVPLVSTFMLSTKKGKEAYVEPVIEGDSYRFEVRAGAPPDLVATKAGTGAGQRKAFRCLMSGTPITYDYVRREGQAGRLGVRLMAIVSQGDRSRVYLPPVQQHVEVSAEASPGWQPDIRLEGKTRVNVSNYGLNTFGDLFTPRQLVALTTFSDLVGKAMPRVRRDAVAAGLPDDDRPLRDGGTGARAYAEAVAVYLAFAVDYAANYWSTIATPAEGFIRGTFARQALPMTWDYAEAPPFGRTSGNWMAGINWISKVLPALPSRSAGSSTMGDAATQSIGSDKVISTDPPYYDNIGYADLSDFFYVWLRRSQKSVFPDLFATLSVPKSDELVATPYRHGNKKAAESFFLTGMTRAMRRLADQSHPGFPVTIYYAFKQSETSKGDGKSASTGWETFLDAVIRAGLGITGTWPVRTERSGRTIGIGTNALASSIVLVCRRRPADAPLATRREFLTALRSELPQALHLLQSGNIAPVDLAQAAIGPGMAIYTRYAKVLNAAGEPMSVREALTMINQILDETLAEQEGDFDADTRWALGWFEERGFEHGDFGVAEMLSKAKNTSVGGLVEAGILESRAGQVRLLRPSELSSEWDPTADNRLTAWETVHHLIRVLENDGEAAAAKLVKRLGSVADVARDLAYRLYSISERKKRAPEALRYNGLVGSLPEIRRLASAEADPEQTGLFESDSRADQG